MPSRASRPNPRLVPWALGLAVLAISFAAILLRETGGLHAFAASADRLLVAGLLLLPITLRHPPRLGLALAASLAYAVHFGAWVLSLGMTSVAASVTAVCTTPLMLALFGLVTGRDPPSRRTWLALALGALGLALMAMRTTPAGAAGTSDPVAGILLALLGAAAMAAYLLLARRAGPSSHALAFTGAAALGAGMLLALTSLALGETLVPTTPGAAWALLGAAVLPQLVGHGLLTWALRVVPPTTVGLAILGEPIGASLLAALFLGEAFELTTALAALTTLAAIALVVTDRRPTAAGTHSVSDSSARVARGAGSPLKKGHIRGASETNDEATSRSPQE